MTTVASAQPVQGRTSGQTSALLRVLIWELRRFSASRLFWFQAVGFFAFQLLIIWALHSSDQVGLFAGNVPLSATIGVTSVRGLLKRLPTYLIILALLLPFITADGVTRDQQRRTHELLLTTSLPTWAYIWGRYLAGLLMGLGLALLLLAAIFGMGDLLHLTDAQSPIPPTDATLLLWVGMVVSATILVSSVGFALSTMWPQISLLVKAVLMVGWLIGALIIPQSLRGATTLPSWYVDWDPTNGVTVLGLLQSYAIPLGATIRTETQLLNLVLSIENKMPDLAGWFAPHLLLAGLSLVLVLIAALTFKRSRATFN